MRTRPAERGETLVEFTVASVVFLMTIFGMIQFGLAVWRYNSLSYLAQEGARWAAVRGSNTSCSCTVATSDDVQTYVRARAVGIASAALTVTTTWPEGHDAGDTVQVIVQSSFTPRSGFIPTPTLSLASTAQMTIAR